MTETFLMSLANSELLARFIYSSNGYRAMDMSVRPEAFLPRNNETSVFRHINLSEDEIVVLGKSLAVGRNYHGRADVKVEDVNSVGLFVEPTPMPRNHANIKGWPIDKPSQKQLAIDLAKKAGFIPA